MIISAEITLRGERLLHVAVSSAFDATATEMANALRFAILDATSYDDHNPRFDQFLIGTSAFDFAMAAYRARRDAVATVPCSQGRPCTTVNFAPEHVRNLDPEEPVVVLRATTADEEAASRLRTTRIAA